MPSLSTISRPEYSAKDLKKLRHQRLTSRAHLNNATILISVLSPSPSPPPLDVALESILSLQSFFIPLVSTLPSSSSSLRDASSTLRPPAGGGGVGEAELAESIYRHWLKARFDEFFDLLSGLAVLPETDENLKVRDCLSLSDSSLIALFLCLFLDLFRAGHLNSESLSSKIE